ncbi:hypothetical protein [Sorangium sp. So ce341]|uniref:hypothetical protein n=1 Tax=Sorangium sp. So ce341 TaxID=3133302 RepID=UPI003F622B6B
MDVVQGWNPLLPWTILFGSSISAWGTSGVTIACDNPICGETVCDLACSPFETVPFSLHPACNSPVSLKTWKKVTEIGSPRGVRPLRARRRAEAGASPGPSGPTRGAAGAARVDDRFAWIASEPAAAGA